jgi:hypothetical protein
MTSANQPMRVKSTISASEPSASLKKGCSSLKKADPKNTALMMKYVAVAANPTGGDRNAVKLMYRKATAEHEANVKKYLRSELIAASMLLSLKE